MVDPDPYINKSTPAMARRARKRQKRHSFSGGVESTLESAIMMAHFKTRGISNIRRTPIAHPIQKSHRAKSDISLALVRRA